MAMDPRSAVEKVARDSYGRLVALLAARSGDIAAAEDALADAFRAAMESWPNAGVPRNPGAWLLVAARRKLVDGIRHARVRANAVPELVRMFEGVQEPVDDELAFPDERLKLLFVCAHPAIDASSRTPLMLQTVLGLDASRIASAFLVQSSAMGQKLSRAKAKIRDAGISFELPGPDDLPQRLDAVLDAIYAAYGSGWEDIAGADRCCKDLAADSIELGRLLAQLMPNEAEVRGLLALMLHCEARRAARRSDAGDYVPLLEQDVAQWSLPLIEEAEHHLAMAARAGHIGRFQLEAAIQSEHAQRADTGKTDWEAIALLYEGLVRLAPTIGALVGRAAAFAEARGAHVGLALLQTIPAESVKSYQPYWALVAHLHKRMGQSCEAAEAFSRAEGLCE